MRAVRNTKQRQKIIDALKSLKEPATAEEIHNIASADYPALALTTVYRNLDRLAADGEVTKYIVDENSPACYVYGKAEEHTDCHCRCLSCGQIIHLHCDEVEKLEAHIKAEHRFYVDHRRTVFYGLCESCYAAGVR